MAPKRKNVVFLSGCSGDAPILYVKMHLKVYRQGKPSGAELAPLYMGADSKPLEKILIIAGDLRFSRCQLAGGLLWGKVLVGISPLLGKMAFSIPP